MSVFLKVGDNIPLRVILSDFNDNLFVRAIITDKNNSELTNISPVNLSNIGNGVYFDNSQAYPDEDIIYVTFLVYLDSGYSILSDYAPSEQIFQKTSDVQQVIEEMENIRVLFEQQPDILNLVGIIDEGVSSSGRVAVIYQGENRSLGCKIRYKEFGEYKGDPFPLINVDEIKASFVGKNRKLFEKTLSNGEISVSSPEYGKIVIHLDEDDTEFMKLGPNQNFIVEVVKSGLIRKINFNRSLEVRKI